MCDKYTNCTDCQDHDTRIRKEALAEDRAKRELTIGDVYFYEAGLEAGRKEGADASIEELYTFCLKNGAERHGDLIGLPNDAFFPLKLIKKIAEMYVESLRAQSPKKESE